jgi:hypothetical protein
MFLGKDVSVQLSQFAQDKLGPAARDGYCIRGKKTEVHVREVSSDCQGVKFVGSWKMVKLMGKEETE